MLKTYANCWETSLARIQQLFLALLLVAGFTQMASATCTINGGTIGNAQTGCGSFDPSAITNVTSVSSPYGGPFAYMWLVTTDINAVNGYNTNWTVISGANGATYDPGPISQTTWYRRCSRRDVSYCTNWDGESNWIKMTVNTPVNATITANSSITQGQSKTITATGGGTYVWSTGATGASITVSPSVTTTYTVTVTGSNGCTAVKTSTVTVTPATGVLTYNCTADITVTAAQGATTAVVTYPAQTASSTCPIGSVSVTRTSGLASGSAFPFGTTQVCHRATDGCGNVKDCCFNVTVNPGAPAVNCNNIGVVAGNGTITVNGVAGAPVVSIQVFDASWNTVYNQYFTNNPGTVNVPNLSGGTYYVKVQYLSATWSELCKKEQTVTVTGTAPVPTVSISDITVNENAGTASLQICASAASNSAISVTYSTSNGTAVAGTDYTTTSATATIPAGQTCTTVTFPILDDNTQEPTESFTVTLGNPTGATIADGTGTVTILDNDSAPSVDCNSVVFTGGTGSVTVSNLSNAGGITIVQAYDANWNQVFNQYYTTTPASVSIPGLTSGNYWVKVQYLTTSWTEICKKELTVTVTGTGGGCSNVTNGGTIGANQTICPGATPAMITSVSAPTGGTGNLEYMWLSSTSGCPTSATQAIAGATGATYSPGALAQTTYFVRCSRRAGCTDWTVGESNCVTITVSNNGCGPVADCSNISFTSGTGSITVGNLSNAGGITMIQAFDANWNAVFNQYYTTTPASVSIPGLTGGNYWVKAQYLTSSWSEICKKEMTVTVQGSTPTPSVIISDITVNENAGTASLQICASAASSTPITVSYSTSNGTAVAGTDYTTTSATATIPAGQTCTTVTFPILDDNTQEPTESFTVTLGNPTGATIADGTGSVTILDNDSAPVADCSNITFTAGNGSITVGNLSNAGGITMIQAFDANWNAVFNQYYTTTPASVTIPGLIGGNYWVKAQYLTSSWSEICKKEMIVTVQGSTPSPTVSISDITVNENAGTASLQICATTASSSPITVTYSTSNGTAVAGTDYTTTSASATIPAGQTCTTVTFPILDDNTQEPTESFNVTLGNPTGATIADGTGTVTILDNDSAPQFDCTTASVVVSGSSITVSNLANAPIIIIQAADPSWNQIFNQWYTTNPGTVTIPATVSGTYYVKVQYLTSAWSEICKKEVYLQVVGTPTGVLTFPQPGNITVTAAQGATTAVVTYPTPTASSTCTVGSVNVTRVSGPASGSSFPVGTTQVCYRATDGCGNSIDRCFNVVVNAPAGPVCNVARTVTNNVERNSNCTMSTTSYGMWFNVNFPGTTNPHYTLSNATFVENEDGTALLTAVATNVQNTNIQFNVSANFCGRTYAAPAGSPKAPCFSYNSNGWYYYTTTCGTLTGTSGAAGTVIQINRRGEAFQVGTGANLNENVFGASGWFNAIVTSGSAAGLTEGDFNFNLSGTPTAPACGTGTANCSNVACYSAPSFETCSNNGCTSYKGKINSTSIGNSMSYSEARDNCNQKPNSSATLTIPAGSVVKKAILNWSGSGSVDNAVTLNGHNISAASTKTDYESAWGLYFFMATADVTSLVQQNGTYTVSDLTWNSSGNYCQSNAAYGAWTLTVVYENSTLPTSVITICDNTFDFSYPAGTYSSTVNNCFASTCATNNSGTLTIVAYEGDGYKTEEFIVNGVVQAGTNNFRGQTAPNLDIFTVSVPGSATSSLTTGVRSYLQNTVWGSANEGTFIAVKIWRYTSCNQSLAAKEESVALSAERAGNSVNLRWMSNTGVDNANYVIERSTDGENFEAILSGDGFSTDAVAYYNEVDAQPAKADNIYRVRMILRDGSERVSNEQRVFMPEVGSFGMYPNPANERVTLDASDFAGQNVTVQLFNQLGKLVQTVEVDATSGLIELNLNDLTSGFYGVSIESNGVKRSSKLLVTKQ